MITWFASVQPLLVGGVLAWAGVRKLRPAAAASAGTSALATLVGERRAPLALRAVGVVELVLAAALVVTPLASAAAVAWTAGLLGYLGYARRHAPESSCGCLGDKHSPVRGRSVGRAGLLLAAAALGLLAGPWWTAFGASPAGVLVVLAVELAAVVTLSPELDHRWLIPLRRWRIRLSHPLAGGTFSVPVESSVQQLVRSAAYRESAAALRSDLLDHWDEGDWRILTYAVADGTAVFAVPRLRYEPAAVRVAIVAEPTGEPVPVP